MNRIRFTAVLSLSGICIRTFGRCIFGRRLKVLIRATVGRLMIASDRPCRVTTPVRWTMMRTISE